MKRMGFLIFIFIWGPVYGGDWGYYVSSGTVNATATYTGSASQYATLKIEMDFPGQFLGREAWFNGICHSGHKVNSTAVLNLKKEIELNINGKTVPAIGMLGKYEVRLSQSIGPVHERKDFVSFWTVDMYPVSDCGKNGSEGYFINRFSGKNSVSYKINDNIPAGSYTGSVNIGKLNAYREPDPQTHREQYGISLYYGADIEVNYTINITNSCSSTPSDIVELRHRNLTTTNFDGDIAKSTIRLTCEYPANISLSLEDDSKATGKGSGNKIELPIKTNKNGVESLLTVEGNNLKYDAGKNKSVLAVGPNGEELNLSSLLKKTANNVTPGEYSGNAVLKIAFD
ncbi:hypothetical protein Xbed_01684 [Xenorhabdus beddingii]|uniref:Fimbrial protein n=1 Tax=Xenorhabdus beddingii TaxID=40578 RepID=A0A1Y2SNF8_9GAMM|nr:hypothetical protein [Xenorhabdus beddingii]OTA20209.1 hypothetical protein Xbed_01684 [Xenorhabdus beddingii]